MLGILPSWQPVNVDLSENFFKRWDFAFGIKGGGKALLGHPAIFERPVACVVEGDYVGTAQPKVRSQRGTFGIPLPFDDNPYDPSPSALRVNDKIQPAPVPP